MDREASCGTVPRAKAEAALNRWLRQPGKARERRAELASWAVKGGRQGQPFTLGKLDEVYLSSERAAQGAVQCIGKRCNEWHVPPVPHSDEPQRIVCKCGTSFCASCRHPYHFRSSCSEALRINSRWLRFLTEELGPFLMAAVKVEPGRYSDILKAHTKCKGALDEAARAAVSRFEELRKMEVWKEKHCRRCPHCQRVVEKVSGCNQMVCGGDFHGGNAQRGCGKSFDWATSKPYEADLRGATQERGDASSSSEHGAIERRLQLDAREEHLLFPGEPLICDGCSEPMVGPRLQCVHCEGQVDLCVGCIGKAAHGRAFALRDERNHPKQHVFRRVRQGILPGGSQQSTIDLAPCVFDLGDGTVGDGMLGAVSDLMAFKQKAPGSSGKDPISVSAGSKRHVDLTVDDSTSMRAPVAGRSSKQPMKQRMNSGDRLTEAIDLSSSDD